MAVISVGIDHEHASLDLLERASVPEHDWSKVLRTLMSQRNIHEAVFVSTCLRTEVVAVICVPPEAAQAVADRLVSAGIHALLNFAPQVLNVPIGTAVHYVDLSIELQILMYHLNNGTGPLGGGLLHSLGIATPTAMRGAL